MNRTAVYKTPQFVAALVGGWLVLAGTFGLIAQRETAQPNSPSARSGNTSLRVVPGTRKPAPSASTQLQGAGGLQGQASSSLQEPGVAEQLQPNAKTDRFTEPNVVQ